MTLGKNKFRDYSAISRLSHSNRGRAPQRRQQGPRPFYVNDDDADDEPEALLVPLGELSECLMVTATRLKGHALHGGWEVKPNTNPCGKKVVGPLNSQRRCVPKGRTRSLRDSGSQQEGCLFCSRPRRPAQTSNAKPLARDELSGSRATNFRKPEHHAFVVGHTSTYKGSYMAQT